MLGFAQVLKPIKWQDLLEKEKVAATRLEQVQKSIPAKKNILGLEAL